MCGCVICVIRNKDILDLHVGGGGILSFSLEETLCIARKGVFGVVCFYMG